MDARICPECRCEYLPTATRCGDCDVDLVHPGEIVEDAPTPELPPAAELVPIRVATVGWSRGFSEALSDAGIPHRIDAPPADERREGRRSHDSGVAVYVLPEHRDRALAVDADYLREQIPDLEASGDAAGYAEDACPACGEPLAPDASECVDCGLFLGEAP